MKPHVIEVDTTDLLKITDVLKQSLIFFKARDEMNAAVHLATGVRYSPLTSRVESEVERCNHILDTLERK